MMNLQQAASAVSGQLLEKNAEFSSVSIDTRTLKPGALYVAIRGERFDGHQFIKQAEQQGASAVMVESPVDTVLPQLQVADGRLALGHLASAWRQQLGLPVVGITGSNGKTSVKEMTAAILSQAGEVYATHGNLNNDFGVPLTLLSLCPEHDFAVVEMGANHHGEIDYLSQLARPNVALVNNAGSAHLEGFGSLRGVAEAKGEIYGGLSADGIAIINRDDNYADYWLDLCGDRRVISFGLTQSADVSASWQGDALGSEICVTTPEGTFNSHLALPGEHSVRNALAATSIALALGVSLQKIAAGLSSMNAVRGRLLRREGINHSSLIDDSYNANPSSFSAAIEVLASCQGKRILVIGDMAELGSDAEEQHRQIGIHAQQAGIEKLYSYGALSAAAVTGFAGESQHFVDQTALIEQLRGELQADVTVLVKGSRSMAMEQVVEALLIERGN